MSVGIVVLRVSISLASCSNLAARLRRLDAKCCRWFVLLCVREPVIEQRIRAILNGRTMWMKQGGGNIDEHFCNTC